MTRQSETTGEARKSKLTLLELIVRVGAVVSLIGGVIGLIALIMGGLHPRVAGHWILENQTETTDYSPYKGMKLTYDIFLTQTGTSLSGLGNKMTENGISVSQKAKTKITISGTVGFTSIDATFEEQGTNRPSVGGLHLQRKMDGSWAGKWNSNVANSGGPSLLKPIEAPSGH